MVWNTESSLFCFLFILFALFFVFGLTSCFSVSHMLLNMHVILFPCVVNMNYCGGDSDVPLTVGHAMAQPVRR